MLRDKTLSGELSTVGVHKEVFSCKKSDCRG